MFRRCLGWGREDRNVESHEAAVEMVDRNAGGDFATAAKDEANPNVADEYENIGDLLGNPDDYNYDLMPGPPASDPNAAVGYGVLPPMAPPSGGPPPPPQPVPAGVIPAANGAGGNLGEAAPAAMAQPGANEAVQEQAAQIVRQGNMNQGQAERHCLAEHWKAMAGTIFVLGAGGAGLYLARNLIWPSDPPPTPKPSKPAPGAQAIDVKADFVAKGVPVTSHVIDLTDTKLQSAGLHGFDVASFAFEKPDGGQHSNRRTSVNGIYELDKAAKTLTFYQSATFMGGAADVGFTVANPDTTSATKTLHGVLTLTFPLRPLVFDQFVDHSHNPAVAAEVNVVTGTLVTAGLKGKAQAAIAKADPIDPGSVTFTGVEITDPLDVTTQPVFTQMNKHMVVPNQGTWVADAAGNVTFTAETGFTGTPYPATFQVGDAKKRPSNVARVIIDRDIESAMKAIEAYSTAPDATFWTAYETVLIKQTPPVDTRQWKEINALAKAYVLMHNSSQDRADAFRVNQRDFKAAKIEKMYSDWQMGAFDAQGNQTRAPYDRQYLWDSYIATITDASTGLTPGKLGTRFVRLSVIERVLARYFRDIG